MRKIIMGGALMKGHLHNNGGRGRSYGLLFLVSFGIAIFGLMVVHNLRERRILNLVLKEKDHQLNSLQLLLQKERQYVKEVKSKMENMKAKMRTLRNQKMEMDSRLLEMQSTISSLKDEQRAIEVALEEKGNEINQLRERSEDYSNETIQTKTLSEILRQKEAEIEELKRDHDLPLKALSVGENDSPINRTSNATENVEGNKFATETAVDPDDMKNKSADDKNENILAFEAEGRSSERIINGSGSNMTREQGSIQREEGVKPGSSTNGETDGMGGEKKNEYGSKATSDIIEDHDEDHTTKSESGSEVHYVGGKKMEMPKNLHGGSYTFRGKHGNISRQKGKRLRLTAKGKEVSMNTTMDTPTPNEGFKMTITGKGESEKGKGDTKLSDNKAHEEIMPKSGNDDHHQNVTITPSENSNKTYEQSPKNITSDHKDRATYNNTSLHRLGDSKQQSKDSKMKDAHEAETNTTKQSDSEEKGEEDEKQ